MSDGHHTISPSAYERWSHCPGAPMAERDMPDTSSEASQEGTDLHAVVADCLTRGVDANARTPFPLNGEQEALVDDALAQARIIIEGADKVFIEERVVLIDANFDELTYGTADILAVFGDLVKVCDVKFGRQRVDINHGQFKVYGAAAAQRFDATAVEVHVIQPRLKHYPSLLYTDVPALISEVTASVKACMDPCAPIIPGPHCIYCKAKLECIACRNMERGLTVKADALTTTDGHTALLTPSMVGAMMETVPVIKKRCAEIEALCKDMTEAGHETGYHFKEGDGARSISDIKGVYALMCPTYISHDDWMSMMSVKIGDLEMVFADAMKRRDGTSARQAKDYLGRMIQDCISHGKPVKKLVKNNQEEQV